jgi:hypothetical protein
MTRIPSGSTDRYLYFVAVDATDLKTRETGLTGFSVWASKNGAPAAAFTTPTVNETSASNMPGVYELLLDEQTTLTAGNDVEELCLHIQEAAMADITRVVEIYRPETTEGNTLAVDASGNGDANVTEWLGTAAATPTVAGVPEVDVTYWTGSAAPAIATQTDIGNEVDTRLQGINLDHLMKTAVANNADMTAEVADGSVLSNLMSATSDTSTFTVADDSLEALSVELALKMNSTEINTTGGAVDTVTSVTNAVTLPTIPANWIAAAGIAANALDGKGDWLLSSDNGSGLTEAGGTGDHLTAIPWNASWDVQVESEVNDGLVALRLDELMSTADAVGPANNSIMAKIASSTGNWSNFAPSTDSLQALRDRGDTAWDRSVILSTSIATLTSQTNFTLSDGSIDDKAYEGLTIIIEDFATSDQKAIGVVDTYTGGTKTVVLLEDPGVFTMAATDKVYILADKSLKPTTSVDYHIDVTSGGAVGIDWGNVENPSTAVDLSATDIQLCDTITTYTGDTPQTGDNFARLGAPAGASVSADIAALNDLSAAQVNAEVLDVLNTDTFAQPGQEAPAATQTVVGMVGYLYKAWRNKSDQTSSTYQLYADDTTTVDQKATVSDAGGTTTKGEVGTGP